jgi:uncharacterized membrane protein
VTSLQRRVAAAFTLAGSLHFVLARQYEAIVPPYVPHHREAVQLSGVAEIVGGLTMASRRTRWFSRWWLLTVLVAVFPANLYMAQEPEEIATRGVPADRIPRCLLYARLPLQLLFARAVWRASRRGRR